LGGEEGSVSGPCLGAGMRGQEQAGRKLQHVFSTETRCGPLSAGASRIHPHRSLSPAANNTDGKAAGQHRNAHVKAGVGYHAQVFPPV